MPLRHIDEVNLGYYLVLFDSDGNERREQDGSLLSETLSEAVQDGVTDVFFSSHGWKGDIPAAISQYNSWIGAMAAQTADRERARALDAEFKVMIVGVHWPSLPWGDENAGAALLADDEPDEFAAEQQMDDEELVQRYAERIADTPEAKTALATILAAAEDDRIEAHLAGGTLPDHLKRAYQTLFDQAGLALGGATAVPGSDQQAFAPTRIMSEWTSAAGEPAQPAADGQPGLLGGGLGRNVEDKLLMPVRQLSFWAMKHRACHVGETGVHSLLIQLQKSAPKARFHLMGHSFGCIVVSAAIAGPLDQGTVTSRLPRPVHSLFLVQGALSLWSFAESLPFPPNLPGYFRPIGVSPALVSGPIVTTRSTFDHAVGTFFPLGAKLGDDLLLGEELPEFGGVGAFGLQGAGTDTTHDAIVLNANADYGFEAGRIYNVDASSVICSGGGPSGAHSDIAHPEIAHLFWQAALAGIASP
jgi:hypothetical protein